jgi:hypothetical protein
MSGRKLKPCGTEAAYRRHLLHGEEAGVPCKAGNARAQARRTVGRRSRWRGPLAHFWANVALPDENGCMLWMGTRTSQGYGQVSMEGKKAQAHRVALLVAEGPPPCSGWVAAHAPVICHRPDCVAPAHLRWATQAQNMADKRQDDTENIGTRNGSAKLTEAQVSAIRLRYKRGGISQRASAAEFFVSQTTILDAVRGRTWAHVREAS